ncbi:MAG: hypothetical protein AB8B47_15545 [Roseobacter sp.]
MDDAGEKLTPSHTRKGEKRYRYYISKKLVTGVTRADEKQRTWRIPARQLEAAVVGAVQKQLSAIAAASEKDRFPGVEAPVPNASEALGLVDKIQIAPGRLTIGLDAQKVQELVRSQLECDPEDLILSLPFSERRRGVEMKIVIANGQACIDNTLLDNIILANACYQHLKVGLDFDQIAAQMKTSKRRVQQMIDVAFLAPDIVGDIVNGKQPLGLTSDWLLRHDLPADWQAQRTRIAKL